ncbi:MAG: endonuclease III [Chloroflexi bacterium]|uniref:Endonuclease III n=1 Tax=Candidatus Chlorohelix allophototropha TaxID=3003348 RepID=A0A8T7MA95_9CHLR|nr:endonuclease III [Chloroflexota bacterium]WJW68998.1 endonuclease III [Chloroflexota bacterium L227-S17]
MEEVEQEYFSQIKSQFDIIYPRLVTLYPNAHCELNYQNAFQLLAATILSAQCTDERVNMTTPALFANYPNPQALSEAQPEELESIIRSCGFYRNKARSLLGMSKMLVQDFSGQVPDTMAELIRLPGVARKTANVVLGNALGKNEGIPVDTHVIRLVARIGLSSQITPEKIEQDLMHISPREEWAMVSHRLIWHGRRVCNARKPLCEQCTLAPDCPTGRQILNLK